MHAICLEGMEGEGRERRAVFGHGHHTTYLLVTRPRALYFGIGCVNACTPTPQLLLEVQICHVMLHARSLPHCYRGGRERAWCSAVQCGCCAVAVGVTCYLGYSLFSTALADVRDLFSGSTWAEVALKMEAVWVPAGHVLRLVRAVVAVERFE